MPPIHFSVSRVRSAAACPRVFYFDADDARARALGQVSVTRIWKAGRDEAAACGDLFHPAVERFNRQAAADPATREILSGPGDVATLGRDLLNLVYRQHVDREALGSTPGRQSRQQACCARGAAICENWPTSSVYEPVDGKIDRRSPRRTVRRPAPTRRRRPSPSAPRVSRST